MPVLLLSSLFLQSNTAFSAINPGTQNRTALPPIHPNDSMPRKQNQGNGNGNGEETKKFQNPHTQITPITQPAVDVDDLLQKADNSRLHIHVFLRLKPSEQHQHLQTFLIVAYDDDEDDDDDDEACEWSL